MPPTLKSHRIASAWELLTKVGRSGEVHMATLAILVDTTDAEPVVRLTGHAIPKYFHWSGRVCGQTLQPLLGANLLSLKDISWRWVSAGIMRWDPGKEGSIGTFQINLDIDRTTGRAVSDSWEEGQTWINKSTGLLIFVIFNGRVKCIFSNCNTAHWHFTLRCDDVFDRPTMKVTMPESWGEVLTKTRMWVLPNDFKMVWWVSLSSTPSLYQWMSISSSSTSTQKAAFSPSRTSTFRGSLRTIVPVEDRTRDNSHSSFFSWRIDK